MLTEGTVAYKSTSPDSSSENRTPEVDSPWAFGLGITPPGPDSGKLEKRFEAKQSGGKGIGLISGSLLFLLDKQVIISYTGIQQSLGGVVMQKIKIRIPVAKRAVIAHKSKKAYSRKAKHKGKEA